MSARQGAGDARLVLGGEPRVQLLPPAVKAQERAAAARRRIAMFVVLSVVVAAAGFAFAWMRNADAQVQLAAARAQTEAILQQQAQYSEGSQALALVDAITTAQVGVTVNEIPWDSVIGSIRGMLPADTVLDAVAATAQAPWEAPLSVEGPLRKSRIATLTLTLVGPTVVDAVGLTSSMARLDGYVDSRFDSSIWNGTSYVTVIRVMLDAEATTGRFTGDGEAATTDTESESDETLVEAEGVTP